MLWRGWGYEEEVCVQCVCVYTVLIIRLANNVCTHNNNNIRRNGKKYVYCNRGGNRSLHIMYIGTSLCQRYTSLDWSANVCVCFSRTKDGFTNYFITTALQAQCTGKYARAYTPLARARAHNTRENTLL